jgi:hypothetical protein
MRVEKIVIIVVGVGGVEIRRETVDVQKVR